MSDAPLLTMSVARTGDVVTVHVTGELDVSTCDRFQSELMAVVADGSPRTLVLELTGLTFVESVGLSVLVRIFKEMQAVDGESAIVLRNPQPWVEKILTITALDSVFRIERA